ncbi:MAG TPA: M28 family peptidase [Longilinea sp.]|nr:M28 family peptidase [Longilinea sp.]
MKRIGLVFLVLLIAGCSITSGVSTVSTSTQGAASGETTSPAGDNSSITAQTPTATLYPTIQPQPLPEQLPEINIERLYQTLADISNIQAYSGWRQSGSQGEQEGLDYVYNQLSVLPFLTSLGTTYEHQSFHTGYSMETWQTGLVITAGNQTYPVPVNGLRSDGSSPEALSQMDSDGVLNDSNLDPETVSGGAVVIETLDDMRSVSSSNTGGGQIVFLNYALIDDNAAGSGVWGQLALLATQNPAGLILVTENSDIVNESHGTFSTEGGPYLNNGEPTLQMSIEDLRSAGLDGWDGLRQATNVEMTWDTDGFIPGTSANLVAIIPGADRSRSMILSAHMDSVGTPGAMDDGSGSAILMEIAYILEENHYQPPVDLVLAWYGSEEIGLYGSGYFANTHQELLDRSIANLQIDCLSNPLQGVQARMQLIYWSGSYADESPTPWVEALEAAIAPLVIDTNRQIVFLASDNSSVQPYNLPNLDIIIDGDEGMEDIGGVWYGGHIHDPYDTVESAREVSTEFTQMAQIALTAALLPASTEELRPTPPSGPRVVFIGSHTEPIQISAAAWTPLTQPFIDLGYDVDLIPYGTTATPADLQDANIVIVLPAADYAENETGAYDEAWLPEELATLRTYAEEGGLLIITNSSGLMGYTFEGWQFNEDFSDMQSVAGLFGVTLLPDVFMGTNGRVEITHPILTNLSRVIVENSSGYAFTITTGEVLVQSDGEALIASIPVGENNGEVLMFSNLSALIDRSFRVNNLPLVENLAAYGISRTGQ